MFKFSVEVGNVNVDWVGYEKSTGCVWLSFFSDVFAVAKWLLNTNCVHYSVVFHCDSHNYDVFDNSFSFFMFLIPDVVIIIKTMLWFAACVQSICSSS